MFTVTDLANSYLKNAISDKENVIGIRLGVRKSGCSGIAYNVDYAYEVSDNDTVFEQDGVKVIVDKIVLAKYLAGTKLDFVSEGMQEGLKFINPKVTGACGCGESFMVEE